MTAAGAFFAKSTDATGKFKDAKFLLDDIVAAISNVGAENVFIVALDGACKSTLRMIWNSPQLRQIFPQRCTTHGCNLLIADIGKLFLWEVTMCVRLVKYVCNHDTIFAILQNMPGSLQLLGAVETRFASQIYSCERILADEVHLKELFSGAPLREFITTRAPADLRAEHQALSNQFIYNQETWDRIRIFVGVELPVRTLLRISDGHKPNLAEICPVYDHMKRDSLAEASKAEIKFPLYYEGLYRNCNNIFQKREKDITSLLCLAAAMVLPKHVYVEDGNDVYVVEGGQAAVISVIDRYYEDVDKQIEALKNFQNFRSKSGELFGSPRLIHAGRNNTADDFWSLAVMVEPVGCEVFRKLVNGYSGQGESERMNKQVKKFRTTTRNRQSHLVTSAYMELDSIYDMMRSKREGPKVGTYLECLRDKYRDVREILVLEAEDRDLAALAAAAADAESDGAEGDEDEGDYDGDIPDVGRDALIDLLNAAAMIE